MSVAGDVRAHAGRCHACEEALERARHGLLGAEAPLIVPVQVEDESTVRREIVVVLRSGVRVEGLTVVEVAELLQRLS